MRFNLKKWNQIQQKRSDLHRKYLDIGEDLECQRRSFAMNYENFISSNTNGSVNVLIVKTLEVDKKSSSSVIEDSLYQLKNNWPRVCKRFDSDKDSFLFKPLIDLYEEMFKLRILVEKKEQASNEFRAHGESFNVLEEFAKTHMKIANTISSPVVDKNPEWVYSS